MWNSGNVEGVVVSSVSVRSTGCKVGAVRIRGSWNSSEPAIKEDKVLSHISEDADVVLGVEVEGLSGLGNVRDLECTLLLRHETLHGFCLLACLDSSFVRMVGREELVIDATNAMVGIIWGNVLSSVLGADGSLVSSRGRIDGVAVLTVQQAINMPGVGKTSGKGVKGSVLLHQNNDVLYTVLPGTFRMGGSSRD